jgi:diaminopimelate epimerase
MTEPTAVQSLEEGVYFTDTGSPHVVILVDSADKLKDENYFRTITRQYRYDPRFEAGGGTNVNLLFRSDEGLKMRTFERGVEDETLSCGTGTVAVTTVMRHLGMMNKLFTIETKGGTLYVEWDGNVPTLIGPAVCVFTGKLSL